MRMAKLYFVSLVIITDNTNNLKMHVDILVFKQVVLPQMNENSHTIKENEFFKGNLMDLNFYVCIYICM